MVRWAAMVASRYLVGKDGRTTYERKRGRRCRVPLATFGERVLYRPLDHAKDRSKMDVQWESGIWLGLSRESNEALIGTSRGVTRAYAIRRRPSDERWVRKAILEIAGTPQRPNRGKAGLHVPTRTAPRTVGTEGGAATGGVARWGQRRRGNSRCG